MLKIKDNVDLKELEKYGFSDKGDSYMRTSFLYGSIFVEKDTKEITRLHPYDLRTIPTKNEIQDLIDADLVKEL